MKITFFPGKQRFLGEHCKDIDHKTEPQWLYKQQTHEVRKIPNVKSNVSICFYVTAKFSGVYNSFITLITVVVENKVVAAQAINNYAHFCSLDHDH